MPRKKVNKNTQDKSIAPTEFSGAPTSIATETFPDLVGKSFASSLSGGQLSRSASFSGGSGATEFPNVDALPLPYDIRSQYYSCNRAVVLCQKAYSRIPSFRTAVDTLTDLANGDIKLYGGNAQTNKFFYAWLKKIKFWSLKEQYFREAFRSGTILFHRVDAETDKNSALNLSNIYAGNGILDKNISIPSRYILLNPAYIWVTGGNSNVYNYYKLLSNFELDKLKNSDDEGDKETLVSIKQTIKNFAGGITPGANTMIPLDPAKLHASFYQKQDYEPLPTPMGYTIMDDLNLYLEFKKADTILARSVEYAMLLLTMGAEKDKGGTDPKALEAMKQIFRNEKVGRVLIGDYTTKASWVIPDIEKAIGQAKYAEVNRNILMGMMNVFNSEDKFASMAVKLKPLIKKLENARNLFINEFLQPEIKRISKILNFKVYPEIRFEPLRIEDQTNLLRIYASLAQFGVISPQDVLEIMDSGLIPDFQTVLDNQKSLKDFKDDGLFQPLQGGPEDNRRLADQQAKTQIKMAQTKMASDQSPSGGVSKIKVQSPNAGRPSGTSAPKTTNKVGTSKAEIYFDAELVSKYTKDSFILKEVIGSEYKKQKDVKRLTASHKNVIDAIFVSILENESPENWSSSVSSYVKNPIPPKEEIVNIVADIAAEFEVDYEAALILNHSKVIE